ncbi:MAG: hypothetical protein AAF292_16280 [Pseudomonadota bacterium]
MPDISWHKFTQHHWKTDLKDGTRLDYWPTKSKWKHAGQVRNGDVYSYIEEYAKHGFTTSEQDKVILSSHWGFEQIDGGVGVYVTHGPLTPSEAADTAIKALGLAIEYYQKQRARA